MSHVASFPLLLVTMLILRELREATLTECVDEVKVVLGDVVILEEVDHLLGGVVDKDGEGKDEQQSPNYSSRL